MKWNARDVPVALLASAAAVAVVVRLSHRAPRDVTHAASAVSIAPSSSSVATSLALAASPGGTAPPIRMQHGDRKRAARESVRGPRSLDLAWKTDVADGAIQTQPIPSPDESLLWIATLGGHLVALDRTGGAVKARIALGGRSYATPCVDAKGNVYSASDAKKLFAVRGADFRSRGRSISTTRATPRARSRTTDRSCSPRAGRSTT